MLVAGPIVTKLKRLVSTPDARPRVLDLFAGCGGLSLGFQAAGYEMVAAVEMDDLAAKSHATNLFKDAPPNIRERHSRSRDITSTEPEELVRELELGQPEEAFDFIVGGPPCQAYARVGRAKLREVAEHPQAFKIDPRANLYLRYLAYVKTLQPIGLLIENVPDILNYGGHNVAQEIVETLDSMGYEARYSLINSAHHGVPQLRDRVYLIAFHKSLDLPVSFPNPARSFELPAGYHGTRAVALKITDLFARGYRWPDAADDSLPPAVTSFEAINDLPPITVHLNGGMRRGKRQFTQMARYRRIDFDRLSCFAQQMRSWSGFSNEEGVYDHVIRYLPRDPAIFAAMKEGDEYPAAHKIALQLFETRAKRKHLVRNSAEWKRLKRSMVPPYDVNTFPNRWWKLRKDVPARTLMAHIGKDTYSHIHYDNSQARVISVREAARLQSFPDGFVFCGAMNAAFRQIGNAVPPLMAKALALEMLRAIRMAIGRQTLPAKNAVNA